MRKYKNTKFILPFFVLVFLLIFLYLGNNEKVEAGPYIEKEVALCNHAPSRQKCYGVLSKNLISEYSLPKILEVFVADEAKPEFHDCHEIAHFLGQEEFKKVRSVRKIFTAPGAHVCGMGVYHGAVEGYFMVNKITDFEKEGGKITEVCGESEDYDDWKTFNECHHGLGHAMMFVTGNELPQALNLCDKLSTDEKRVSCYNGALMANGMSFNSSDHPTKFVKTDDLLYPCPLLTVPQQKECYTTGVLYRFQNDVPTSIKICSSVPTEFQTSCFETFGRERVSTATALDRDLVKKECEKIKSIKWRGDCYNGVVNALKERNI